MKKDNRIYTETSILVVPAMAVLAVVLQFWLSGPTALAASVLLVSLALFLFERRRVSFKRFILFTLPATLAVYLLAALWVKLTGHLW
jgi:hypothetical protein